VIVLAIDTSHPVGSAAVAMDDHPAGTVRFGGASSHLLEIGEAVDGLLVGHGLAVRDVDRVALVQGPGSFTGLRIGMAFAKGLCVGLGAEMVVISTLELLAIPLLREGSTVCPMIDARRGEVYGAVYEPVGDGNRQRGSTRVEPCACKPEAMVELAKLHSPVYLGTGALRYRSVVESIDSGCRIAGMTASLPSASLLAEIAASLEPLSRQELAPLEPIYIRSSDAVFKPLNPLNPHGRHRV
jgi:tRNA threonylcarbamoyladenosine biosynthesis protein TsaB